MFYILTHTHCETRVRGDTGAGEEPPWNRGEAPVCPACGEYVGLLPWLPPHRAELVCYDREFGDLAFPGGESILVSERFKSLYHQYELIGLTGFEPVEIVRVVRRARCPKIPPPYYHVQVTRTEAAIDLGRSGFVWTHPEKVCRVCREGGGIRRWERIIIEEPTWKGEDIFIPRGLTIIVTSERFKRFCDQEQFINAVLVPAEEFWDDMEPWYNVEKGREIMAREPGQTLLEKRQPNGDIWRYDTVGAYLVVASPNGTVRDISRTRDKEFLEKEFGYRQ